MSRGGKSTGGVVESDGLDFTRLNFGPEGRSVDSPCWGVWGL